MPVLRDAVQVRSSTLQVGKVPSAPSPHPRGRAGQKEHEAQTKRSGFALAFALTGSASLGPFLSCFAEKGCSHPLGCPAHARTQICSVKPAEQNALVEGSVGAVKGRAFSFRFFPPPQASCNNYGCSSLFFAFPWRILPLSFINS